MAPPPSSRGAPLEPPAPKTLWNHQTIRARERWGKGAYAAEEGYQVWLGNRQVKVIFFNSFFFCPSKCVLQMKRWVHRAKVLLYRPTFSPYFIFSSFGIGGLTKGSACIPTPSKLSTTDGPKKIRRRGEDSLDIQVGHFRRDPREKPKYVDVEAGNFAVNVFFGYRGKPITGGQTRRTGNKDHATRPRLCTIRVWKIEAEEVETAISGEEKRKQRRKQGAKQPKRSTLNSTPITLQKQSPLPPHSSSRIPSTPPCGTP